MLETQPRATAAPGENLADTDSTDETSESTATPDSGESSPSCTGEVGDQDRPMPTRSRRISISIKTLSVTLAFGILCAAVAVMSWLYVGERGKLEAQQRQSAAHQHAEQIALDYAVGAATMKYQDLNTWKGTLVKDTTPALKDKLTKAAGAMEQLFIPLEWTSTAQPIAAKVRSDNNGVYVVDTFVSVLTKTTQAPDNLQSTATYSITIDSNQNWQISDVGGIGALTAPK